MVMLVFIFCILFGILAVFGGNELVCSLGLDGCMGDTQALMLECVEPRSVLGLVLFTLAIIVVCILHAAKRKTNDQIYGNGTGDPQDLNGIEDWDQ